MDPLFYPTMTKSRCDVANEEIERIRGFLSNLSVDGLDGSWDTNGLWLATNPIDATELPVPGTTYYSPTAIGLTSTNVTVNSPTTNNNYALPATNWLTVTTNQPVIFTGLAQPASTSTYYQYITNSGPSTITLNNLDSGSTSANQFKPISVSNFPIPIGQTAVVVYDPVLTKWVPTLIDLTAVPDTYANNIVTSQNNFPLPTAVTTVLLAPQANVNVTGLAVTNPTVGQNITISNTSSASSITLVNNSGSSTYGSQITTVTGANVVLPPKSSVTLYYNGSYYYQNSSVTSTAIIATGTLNKIPKVTVASPLTYGDSSLTDDGTKVTLGEPLITAASTTAGAGFNLPAAGVAPTSPTSGDLWYDGTHLDFRNGGTTVDLLASSGGVTGSGTTGYLSAWTGTTALGNSVLDYGVTTGGTVTVNASSGMNWTFGMGSASLTSSGFNQVGTGGSLNISAGSTAQISQSIGKTLNISAPHDSTTDGLLMLQTDSNANTKIGMYGTGGAPQHAAIADVDITTVVAGFNTLLAFLRARGDIAT